MDTLNIEKYGFNHTGNIFRNNPPGALVEKALLHKEGRLSRAFRQESAGRRRFRSSG